VGHGGTKNNGSKCIGDPGEKLDMNKSTCERQVLVTRTKSGHLKVSGFYSKRSQVLDFPQKCLEDVIREKEEINPEYPYVALTLTLTINKGKENPKDKTKGHVSQNRLYLTIRTF
jgi:hypothetical protein